MTQPGGFADLDVDRLVGGARARFEALRGLRDHLSTLEGSATSEDGRITATCTADGLRDLRLDPRVLHGGADDLAARIVAVVRDATRDLHERSQEAVRDALGGGEDTPERMRASFDRTLGDVMGELDRIRRRLGL